VFAPAGSCFLERNVFNAVETLRVLDYKPLSASSCGDVSKVGCGKRTCAVRENTTLADSVSPSIESSSAESKTGESSSSKTPIIAGVGGGFLGIILVAGISTVIILYQRRKVAMQGL
jgi:hypothetical protein